MYYLFSLFSGILVAVMLAVNGSLSVEYGLYASTVFIHISGLALISVIMAVMILAKREKITYKRQSWYLYLGGPVGVLTTILNNFAFGRISVSAILALTLLGQSIAGLVIDQYGLFGMTKHPFIKQRIVSLLIISVGIAVMIDKVEIFAVVFSFLAGAIVVLTRTTNARLAELTSVRSSTLLNYTFGLLVSIPVFFILGSNEPGFTNVVISPDWYMYLGGIIGVCVVLLCNVLVVRISAFYLTLLAFSGQVFSGIAIDALLSGFFSKQILIGGALVATGLCADLFLIRKFNVPKGNN